MVRKLLLVFGLLFVASLSAQAQDTAEVFGGYSYMHFHNSGSSNLNGWEIAGQYKFTEWLGGVADVDGHYGSLGGISTSTYTYLFGPQISLPSRVSPFGHLLLGGAHISGAGFGNSSFAMALGGGIDARISSDRFYWRVIQLDYLITQFGSNSQNNFRLSTGIVIRF
jgi:Outer membrane protein beta-barrel domain